MSHFSRSYFVSSTTGLLGSKLRPKNHRRRSICFATSPFHDLLLLSRQTLPNAAKFCEVSPPLSAAACTPGFRYINVNIHTYIHIFDGNTEQNKKILHSISVGLLQNCKLRDLIHEAAFLDFRFSPFFFPRKIIIFPRPFPE